MFIDGLEVAFVSRNADGNWYVGFVVPVQRGIKGKTKSKVNELLIVGMHDKKFRSWCENHGVCVVQVDEQKG